MPQYPWVGARRARTPRAAARVRGRRCSRRPWRTAEDLGGLGLGQVVEVAKDEHGALAGRQPPERLDQLSMGVQRRERIDRTLRATRTRRLELDAAPSPATSAVRREINENPPRISTRLVHRADPRPAPSDPEQTLLDEILSLDLVPRDQIRGPQQVVDVGGDKLVKVGVSACHQSIQPHRRSERLLRTEPPKLDPADTRSHANAAGGKRLRQHEGEADYWRTKLM
jgi:hypothetical protein